MKAFEALYREHVQAVYRFAISVTGRKEIAEDLTSEAFLALYRTLDSIDESRLPGWLLTVVRNRARDIWRHQEVEQRHAGQLVRPVAVESETPDLERWILEHADLKPVHRTCIMLRYVHGLTRTEIAETTGLTETQVKGHLQYGLNLLRKAYVKGPADR
jgi:RNA polymerase sigma-70 factor (ECF subfamily)